MEIELFRRLVLLMQTLELKKWREGTCFRSRVVGVCGPIQNMRGLWSLRVIESLHRSNTDAWLDYILTHSIHLIGLTDLETGVFEVPNYVPGFGLKVWHPSSAMLHLGL